MLGNIYDCEFINCNRTAINILRQSNVMLKGNITATCNENTNNLQFGQIRVTGSSLLMIGDTLNLNIVSQYGRGLHVSAKSSIHIAGDSTKTVSIQALEPLTTVEPNSDGTDYTWNSSDTVMEHIRAFDTKPTDTVTWNLQTISNS